MENHLVICTQSNTLNIGIYSLKFRILKWTSCTCSVVLYSGKYHDMSFNYPLEWSHEQIWLSSKTVQMKLPAKCPLNASQQSVENVER